MSPLTSTSIETIPRVLLLVVGVLGLIFSIKGRSKGVSGFMVGAFAVMLVTTVAGIVWQFVALNAASWSRSSHLSVDDVRLIFLAVGIPLDVAAVLSWLLVVIAVVKGGRPPRQAGFPPYPGPAGYPMVAQPGFVSPQHGYPHTQQPPN
ncbi:hypothetical protein AB0M83_12070 [Amycolatopsis sp. NPDC051106]|uniref:hypothetical protein n=1 Tax=unclassified Amycolatopsis TaxID=2618356 RepID=UPI0034128793